MSCPLQMATPRRKLHTGGKGAPWRLGTFAHGGFTNSPSLAWETPLKPSGQFQVYNPTLDKRASAYFITKEQDWYICSFIASDWLVNFKSVHTPLAAGGSVLSQLCLSVKVAVGLQSCLKKRHLLPLLRPTVLFFLPHFFLQSVDLIPLSV